MNITVVGGGTAGFIAAIVLKTKLPKFNIKIIESTKKSIIGVGEGSTEHWRIFCEECSIDVDEMVSETLATHKYGIRFENWTTHTPDYFHSIGFYKVFNGSIQVYDYVNSLEKLLTNSLTNPCFIENKISYNEDKHKTTNQFHFDTFKLNEYFHKIALARGIAVVDDEIGLVNVDSTSGHITSVEGKQCHFADFWIDASGFSRILMKALKADKWESYSDFLLTDTAIPFPTALEENNEIRPYTRAIAMSSGWMWEIPTQQRRGNGYAFSSSHISEEHALVEIEKVSGFKVENPRVISFKPGRLKIQWEKNCVPIGLASAFVEPLEATSISTSIQQARALSTFLATFKKENQASVKKYNEIMDKILENLVSMISLHYISDRRDTDFWIDASTAKKPELLEELLSLWKERPPHQNDFSNNGYELFQTAHFWHVAQGQGLIDKKLSILSLNNYQAVEYSRKKIQELRSGFLAQKVVLHRDIF
jgi:tryptophan halogenase